LLVAVNEAPNLARVRVHAGGVTGLDTANLLAAGYVAHVF
jgi:hypothetical protein